MEKSIKEELLEKVKNGQAQYEEDIESRKIQIDKIKEKDKAYPFEQTIRKYQQAIVELEKLKEDINNGIVNDYNYFDIRYREIVEKYW